MIFIILQNSKEVENGEEPGPTSELIIPPIGMTAL